MRLLVDAFEYNAWATRQLIDVCGRIPQEQLTRRQEWQYNSLLGLWRHIDDVERAYLGLMGVAERPEPKDSIEAYLASADASGAAFAPFVEGLDVRGMERLFNIPWFGRDFTVADGLFQVLTHSTQHRADIAHFLARLGHDTPPIDYVIWIYLRDGGAKPE